MKSLITDYQQVKEFMRQREHRPGAEDIYAAMEEYAEQRAGRDGQYRLLDVLSLATLKLIREIIEQDSERFDDYIAEREAWQRGGVDGIKGCCGPAEGV